MKTHLLITLVLLVAGCLSPSPQNGAVQCSADGACPSGYSCAADNRCYKPDALPDLSAAMDMATDDLGGISDGGPNGPDLAPAPAHLTIDSTMRDYGTIVQGSMSAAARFTITNDGGSSTGSLMVVLGGTNASSFAKVADNCNTVSLLPQASCTIDVKLQPVAPTTGAVAATVTVSASPGGSVNVMLSGNVVAPGALTIMPSSEDFMRLETNQTSAARQFMVRNTGGAATDVPMVRFTGTDATHFTFTTTCSASLLPNGTCTVDVKFAPKRADAIAAQLEVSATPVGGTATASVSGFGTLPNGTASNNAALCTSMVIADGVCCNMACSGTCRTCATGTCSPKPTTTQCNQTCANATTQTNFFCNASGDCDTSGTNVPCTAYVCAPNACKTTCATNADCQTGAGYSCSNGKCVLPESDCLDGVDNNGDGLADCADPSCTAQVTCVPAAGAGAEIGTQLGSGACPSGFNNLRTLYKNLTATGCTGCGCDWEQVCRYDMVVSTTTDTCGSPIQLGTVDVRFNSLGAFTSDCRNAATAINGPKSVGAVNARVQSVTCTGKGTATMGTPSWGASTLFCSAAASSSTCGTGQVCVPKPSSTPICLRIPSAGAACPAGFTTGMTDTFYSGFSDSRSCGPCTSCTTTAGSCRPAGVGSNSAVCPGTGQYEKACFVDSTGCGDSDFGSNFAITNPVRSVGVIGLAGVTTSCAGFSVTNGQLTPTGGTTLCCR